MNVEQFLMNVPQCPKCGAYGRMTGRERSSGGSYKMYEMCRDCGHKVLFNDVQITRVTNEAPKYPDTKIHSK